MTQIRPGTGPRFEKELRTFLDSRRLDQGASQHTLEAYHRDLLRLFESLPPSVNTLAAITPQHLEKHLAELSAKAGLESTSLARKTSAFRQFFKFCCRELSLTINPAESLTSPKTKRHLPDTLSIADAETLIQALHPGLPYQDEDRATLFQARDRAMVYLAYASGLRVSELTGLTLDQVDLRARLLRIQGKGGKHRLVPFATSAGDALEAYLKLRPQLKPLTEHVFLNPRGLALSRQAYWKILKSLALVAGVKHPVWPHLLRHTFASHLLESGLNLRSLQMLLGHSDLSTTQIYTQLSTEHLKDIHREFHPRGKR